MTEPPQSPIPLLSRFEDGLLVLLMALLLVVSFGQILLRNLFEMTLLWGEPLARHLVMWTAFLGALVATREGKHIRIDVLLRFLSGARRSWALLASELVSAATCGTLTWVALNFVADERRYGAVGFLDLPIWVLQLVFPLCFGLMACRYTARFARRTRALVRGDSAP